MVVIKKHSKIAIIIEFNYKARKQKPNTFNKTIKQNNDERKRNQRWFCFVFFQLDSFSERSTKCDWFDTTVVEQTI